MTLVLAAVAAQPAQAATTKASSYQATIVNTQTSAPTAQLATPPAPATFSLAVTNASTSSNYVGSVQVVVPSSFTNVRGGTTTPSGWVFSFPSCSSDSPAGCGATGTTLLQVNTPNGTGAVKILPGQSLTFTLAATPTAKGSFTWPIQVKNSAAWSNGTLLSNVGNPLVVTVYGQPDHLVWDTDFPPPTSTTAGQPFQVKVDIVDAQGQPTLSDATVSLSDSTGSLCSTACPSVQAYRGTADFSSVSLTKVVYNSQGVLQNVGLTATSGTLSTPAAGVLVSPAAPDSISSTLASGQVPAGGTLTVSVTVDDRYANGVSNPNVSVSAQIDTGPTTTRTTLGGSTSFDLTAPTTTGGHVVTVSTTNDGSTLSQSTTFQVQAGAPYKLHIDSVTDQGDLGVLTQAAPFDVTVSALDFYGNPTAYTGFVSLDVSAGGTGSHLGTLGGTTCAAINGTSTTIRGATYSGYGNLIPLNARSASSTAPGTCTQNSDLVPDQKKIDVSLTGSTANGTPGTSLTLDLANCTDATVDVPMCSKVLLPHGANGKVTLSEGECDPITPCIVGPLNRGLLINNTANLTGLYTRSSPATLIIECDKTLCGGSGTNSFPLINQPSGETQFLDVPACPKKGTIGRDQRFCQDFVQNKRDNAGDLIAYMLFLDDQLPTFKRGG